MDVTAEMQRVIEYIDTHLNDDITIAALAEVAGYSPWHLYHVFMGCIGTPVMEYVRVQRLHRAVQELAHGRTLYDIALDYGFETQAGFYKAFQRQFGCSPSRYRRHTVRGINRQISPELLEMASGGEDMQDRVIIRIVEERDADDLWENIFSRNTPHDVKDRVAGYLRAYAAEKAIPLVAEVDSHVIGFLSLTFEEHPLASHICSLGDFVVNPAFQRMGIGRRLVEASKVTAVEKGRTLIKLCTRGGTAAETVYRKLGFIEYGRLPNGIVEHPPFWETVSAYDEVLFYLPLASDI